MRIQWTGSFPPSAPDQIRWFWAYASAAWTKLLYTKNGQACYLDNTNVPQEDLDKLKWFEETADPEI